MPYRVEQRGDQWCVVKKDGGKLIGCSDSEEKANAQIRAIHAHEDLAVRIESLERAVLSFASVELGDYEGHPFRGNQWTQGAADELKEAGINAEVTKGDKIRVPERDDIVAHLKDTADAAKALNDRGYETKIGVTGEDGRSGYIEVTGKNETEAPAAPKNTNNWGVPKGADVVARHTDTIEAENGFDIIAKGSEVGTVIQTAGYEKGTKPQYEARPATGEVKDASTLEKAINYVLEKTQAIHNIPVSPITAATPSVVERMEALESAVISLSTLEFGDVAGHEFHGNQYTGGFGGSVEDFVRDNPQHPGEEIFEWQARIVKGLDPETQNQIINATRERYTPCAYLYGGVNQWNREHDLPELPTNVAEMQAPLGEADAVARFFENAQDQSGDPRVQAAYEDFKEQNAEMYDYLTRPRSEGGLGVDVDFVNVANPYPTAEAQARDLIENHHLSIASGLGGAHEATMSLEEYNQFRAVHDAFGHASIGRGFDRHGEYEAWIVHSTMYTGLARDAMSTEYHGVNSALWSGEPGTPGTGKSILLPEQYSLPPWEKEDTVSLTAAATKREVNTIVKALRLDSEWATKYSAVPFHTNRKGQLVASASKPPRGLSERITVLEAAVLALGNVELGDVEGHPFHGNQWTGGLGNGEGTKDDPIKTDDVNEAAKLIAEGKFVELDPDSVSILLDKLADVANQAKAAGKDAPNYDLCKISVPDSNLFCVDSKGIPRIDMPQFSGVPVPGSPASKLEADSKGKVDITNELRAQLHVDGYNFHDESVPAASLKATQNELNGAKVAGMMKSIEAGTLPPGRVFVSSDNYVIDGHHRWAAQVGEDYSDSKLGDVNMDVTRIDAPIAEILDYSNYFAFQMGIPQAAVASGYITFDALMSLEFGDLPGHDFHGNQHTGGIGGGLDTKVVMDATMLAALKTWASSQPRGTVFRAMSTKEIENAQVRGLFGRPDYPSPPDAGPNVPITGLWVSQVAKGEYLDKGEVIGAFRTEDGDVLRSGGPGDLRLKPLPFDRLIDTWTPPVTSSVQRLEFGDLPGHPFRGNQYTYEVDYAVDHEAMQRGEYETHKVKVQADNVVDANLMAAQMVGHRGIPVETRHISTLMEVKTASHGEDSNIKSGDVVVAAPPHMKSLEGATLKQSVPDLGVSRVDYTSKYGYEKRDHYHGGETLLVERPAAKGAFAAVEALEAAVVSLASLELGDSEGHPFRGNQYTGGRGGEDELGHYLMDKEGDMMLTKPIQSLVDRVAEAGGVTIEPLTGNEPTTGYIVATETPSKIVDDEKFIGDRMHGVTVIEDFLVRHVDEFNEDNAMLGIWHDTEHGEVVLDVVEHVDDRAEAVKLGVERDQQSVWDVVNSEEIKTGGTGGREQAESNQAA